MKSIITYKIAIFIIVLLSPGVHLASTSDTESHSSLTLNQHIRTKRHHNDADFEPRFIHQPHSVEVKPRKPHTVECPVEARPEAEVKWFKDDQLLESEPTHLEQTGSELMFFQINDQDTGDYYCQATNYLGSITSKRFKIVVLSTVHDANIRLEPQLTEVDWSLATPLDHHMKSIELTCTLPLSYLPSARRSSASTKSMNLQQQRLSLVYIAELISWRKDGRVLPVMWSYEQPPADEEQLTRNNLEPTGSEPFRYEARQKSANEFVLLIISQQQQQQQLQLKQAPKTRVSGPPMVSNISHNITCAFRSPIDDGNGGEDELVRESNAAKVTVWLAQHQQQQTPIGSDVNMAAPINDLANTSGPNQLTNSNNNNQTTQLSEVGGPMSGGKRRGQVSSLTEILRDLYELARPTLLILAVVCLIGLVLLLQFIFIRRRARENMSYMKHHPFHHHHNHHHHSSAATMSGGSGGSGASSALGGSLDCDPVLSSLLSRTLSGPSAGSLTGVSKKYKSYRDHMRKVAAANDLVGSNNADFMEVSPPCSSYEHQSHLSHPTAAAAFAFATNTSATTTTTTNNNSAILPNLYNQSLAAREQARSLLYNNQQTNEHMRSLSNLSSSQVHSGNKNSAQQHAAISQQQQQQQAFARPNGSHLNLPLAFAFDSNHQQTTTGGGGLLEAGASQLLHHNAIWPPHLLQLVNRNQPPAKQQQQLNQQTHHQQDSEHYQLVSCSSISPSSSSSASSSSAGVGASNSSASSSLTSNPQQKDTPASDQVDHHQRPTKPMPRESTNSSNHYSIIETNDEDDRYEVLDRASTEATHETGQRGSQRFKNDGHQERNNLHRISTFITPTTTTTSSSTGDSHPQQKSGQHQIHRSSNSSTTSGCGDSTGTTSSSLTGGDAFARFGSRRSGRGGASQALASQDKFQDQLSPYAVSSICGNLPMPPPVNSEAMRALKEQFDINQLILAEDPAAPNQLPSLPFNPPPPPSPPHRAD